MQQFQFLKTVPYLESTAISHILVVQDDDNFSGMTSPNIIQDHAQDYVRDYLAFLEEKKVDLNFILSYLKAEGYVKN